MSKGVTEQVTGILADIRGGDPSAAARLLPLVYRELRALAAGMMKQQPPGHTLQPTAVVHEAYLRLVNQSQAEWQDRSHFLGVAARAMRSVLVDHARKRGAKKRGSGWDRLTLDDIVDSAAERSIDLLALDEALEQLSGLHERQARVVELRFFGGLTIPEAAEVLGVSSATIDNDWAMARAWLTCRLNPQDEA